MWPQRWTRGEGSFSHNDFGEFSANSCEANGVYLIIEQRSLFSEPIENQCVPEGLRYKAEFITPEQEAALVEWIDSQA